MRRDRAQFEATACCIFVVLASTVGCSHSPYELASVKGKVTIDGAPLPQAKVMFAPVETGGSINPGKPAFGLLADDGTFTLTTYEKNDGAVVGEHWVSIVRLNTSPNQVALVHPARKELQFNRLTLPRKVTVVADQENQVDLTLTSQDVSRYGVVVRD